MKSESLFVKSHKNMIFFYGRNNPLSQWFLSEMYIDRKIFTSAEQWMMYSKANVFNDLDSMNKIMLTNDPSNQRKIGRQIKGFKEPQWKIVREQIVYKGNFHKFSQNETLKEFLLNTGDLLLAEASPTDLIWGIGFSENEEGRFDKANWRGENLLGEILMLVRNDLRNNNNKRFE